jgi:cytidyltransferase-like protein
VIGEFDPFHEGHRYLLEKTREETGLDLCVSVMSGDFTERGLPASEDKWIRSRRAVENGVDLVLEIPAVFVLSGAGNFARAGAGILEGIGCVDTIAFGTESGDMSELKEAAGILKACEADGAETGSGSDLGRLITEGVKQGMNYPLARMNAVKQLYPDFDTTLLELPNNILALEYLNFIEKAKPFTIKRVGAGHTETATALRKKIRSEKPEYYSRMDRNYFSLLEAQLIRTPAEEAERIYASGGGLAYRAKQEARGCTDLEGLIDGIKSKAYTRTRVQRYLAELLLDIEKSTVDGAALYGRVLAFNERGAKLLKYIRKNELATIPVITNINRYRASDGADPAVVSTLGKDIEASDFYNIITERDLYLESDYVKIPDISV